MATSPPERGARYAIYVDGSCDHRLAMGAAAEIRPLHAEMQPLVSHVLGRKGYFVGPTASELTSMILGYRAYGIFQSSTSGDAVRCLDITMFTDSAHGLKYLDGFTPTSAAGWKLLPLINLLRAEARLRPELHVWKCSRAENCAHHAAVRAMRVARDGAGDVAWNGDGDLLAALLEVEARTRAVHP